MLKALREIAITDKEVFNTVAWLGYTELNSCWVDAIGELVRTDMDKLEAEIKAERELRRMERDGVQPLPINTFINGILSLGG